ncbi:MAG: hypothetical protein MUP03_07475, partial [Anaerolineales bacterium]|nr:hypothetical protein [Anaerolineales bacterium]
MTNDKDELLPLIVQRLSSGTNENDLVLEICEEKDMSWSDAESLVQQVKIENEGEIVRRQSPLLFVLAGLIFVGGAVITTLTYFYLSTMINEAIAMGTEPMNLFAAFFYIINYAPAALALGIMGPAM